MEKDKYEQFKMFVEMIPENEIKITEFKKEVQELVEKFEELYIYNK